MTPADNCLPLTMFAYRLPVCLKPCLKYPATAQTNIKHLKFKHLKFKHLMSFGTIVL